ncbi:MAG TPA: hypothetical protein VND70_07075 [Acidimicrobiales bacterium]|nr:hypothetical protein [Acidimicrobiales bacterium]
MEPALVACTGATTANFMTAPDKGGSSEWNTSMGRFDLVTFTFGGDDIGFTPILYQCLGLSRLVATVENASADIGTGAQSVAPLPSDPGHTCPTASIIEARITAFAASYRAWLEAVANVVVVPGGNIVVLGYPDLIELPKFWHLWEQKIGSCWGIGTADATELRALAGDLNATIGEAVAADNTLAPNGVHMTFVDVNSANGATPSNDADLVEPSSGTRHNLCSADPWLNGATVTGSLSATDDLNHTFHPNQAGNDAMGALAGGDIGKLDWSKLAISEASAKTELTALTVGMSTTLVEVPGGYEAATYDQQGNIDFWKLDGDHPWIEVGQSTYPILGSTHLNPPEVTVTGALLSGMSNATFIAEGIFTGDGSGNFIAFSNGQSGWGTLAPRSYDNLVPTGAKSTDNGTPGIAWRISFEDGLLETSQDNPFFSTAEGGIFPLTIRWKWTGTRFTDVHDTIFTAHLTSAPGPATPLPGTCPSIPPDGTYEGYIEGYPTGQSGGSPTSDGKVHFFIGQNPTPTGITVCQFAVDPSLAMTVQATTKAGGTVWVTAPAWFLVSDEPSLLGPTTPLTLHPEEVKLGSSPYYVPSGLGLSAISSDLGVPDIPDITQGIGLVPTPTYGQVNIHDGKVTAIAILPNIGNTDSTPTTAPSGNSGDSGNSG